VKQGCGLSLTLFNVYINQIIIEWKQTAKNGIWLASKKLFKQYFMQMISKSKIWDWSQITIQQLNKTAHKYDIKISISQTKVMGKAKPQIRYLGAGFPPWWGGFDPRSSYAGFVVGKVALGLVFSKCFGFPYQLSFHQMPGRRSPLGVTSIPHGLSLTPTYELQTWKK
jgi:hypothetical protein